MDTTPGPDDISDLADADPAEAPELADSIVDRLAAELDATGEDAEETITEEQPPDTGGSEGRAGD